MARILHNDMVLVLGDGRINTRAEQLQEARDRLIEYAIQDEDPGTQTVRVYGDTAVVTARLRIKGHESGNRLRATLVVQRHLCAHRCGLALLLRPGLAGTSPRKRRRRSHRNRAVRLINGRRCEDS